MNPLLIFAITALSLQVESASFGGTSVQNEYYYDDSFNRVKFYPMMMVYTTESQKILLARGQSPVIFTVSFKFNYSEGIVNLLTTATGRPNKVASETMNHFLFNSLPPQYLNIKSCYQLVCGSCDQNALSALCKSALSMSFGNTGPDCYNVAEDKCRSDYSTSSAISTFLDGFKSQTEAALKSTRRKRAMSYACSNLATRFIRNVFWTDDCGGDAELAKAAIESAKKGLELNQAMIQEIKGANVITMNMVNSLDSEVGLLKTAATNQNIAFKSMMNELTKYSTAASEASNRTNLFSRFLMSIFALKTGWDAQTRLFEKFEASLKSGSISLSDIPTQFKSEFVSLVSRVSGTSATSRLVNLDEKIIAITDYQIDLSGGLKTDEGVFEMKVLVQARIPVLDEDDSCFVSEIFPIDLHTSQQSKCVSIDTSEYQHLSILTCEKGLIKNPSNSILIVSRHLMKCYHAGKFKVCPYSVLDNIASPTWLNFPFFFKKSDTDTSTAMSLINKLLPMESSWCQQRAEYISLGSGVIYCTSKTVINIYETKTGSSIRQFDCLPGTMFRMDCGTSISTTAQRIVKPNTSPRICLKKGQQTTYWVINTQSFDAVSLSPMFETPNFQTDQISRGIKQVELILNSTEFQKGREERIKMKEKWGDLIMSIESKAEEFDVVMKNMTAQLEAIKKSEKGFFDRLIETMMSVFIIAIIVGLIVVVIKFSVDYYLIPKPQKLLRSANVKMTAITVLIIIMQAARSCSGSCESHDFWNQIANGFDFEDPVTRMMYCSGPEVCIFSDMGEHRSTMCAFIMTKLNRYADYTRFEKSLEIRESGEMIEEEPRPAFRWSVITHECSENDLRAWSLMRMVERDAAERSPMMQRCYTKIRYENKYFDFQHDAFRSSRQFLKNFSEMSSSAQSQKSGRWIPTFNWMDENGTHTDPGIDHVRNVKRRRRSISSIAPEKNEKQKNGKEDIKPVSSGEPSLIKKDEPVTESSVSLTRSEFQSMMVWIIIIKVFGVIGFVILFFLSAIIIGAVAFKKMTKKFISGNVSGEMSYYSLFFKKPDSLLYIECSFSSLSVDGSTHDAEFTNIPICYHKRSDPIVVKEINLSQNVLTVTVQVNNTIRRILENMENKKRLCLRMIKIISVNHNVKRTVESKEGGTVVDTANFYENYLKTTKRLYPDIRNQPSAPQPPVRSERKKMPQDEETLSELSLELAQESLREMINYFMLPAIHCIDSHGQIQAFQSWYGVIQKNVIGSASYLASIYANFSLPNGCWKHKEDLKNNPTVVSELCERAANGEDMFFIYNSK